MSLKFKVMERGHGGHRFPDTFTLEPKDWDDRGYQTLFDLYYRDAENLLTYIGQVKIAQFDVQPRYRHTVLPDQFEQLKQWFFSLGQDASYYERLNELGDSMRDAVLLALNDVAANHDLFERALGEQVTGVSVLRNVPRTTVWNQFHRLALGGARTSAYSFRYSYQDGPELFFSVVPESQPPTNVHVIIGRNGVGKSRLLNQIANILLKPNNDSTSGAIEFMSPANSKNGNSQDSGSDVSSQFANLISVAFSAFDEFEPLPDSQDRSHRLSYRYVGLKKIARSGSDETGTLKDSRALAVEFGTSVKVCLQGERKPRWERALQVLESDPIFADAQVATLAAGASDDGSLRAMARDLFRGLSSGHKIVLLTITRLVETIEERSLVLLDEPESHLHPPLLSAFVRALSELLIHRNGVAIIATHSPVVLQEVPRDCVWRLRRAGNVVEADRPKTETFGENVGTLTSEVFGLEVTNSGFHRMLAEAVSGRRTYAEVLASFDGKIGSEARALVQTLLAVSPQGH